MAQIWEARETVFKLGWLEPQMITDYYVHMLNSDPMILIQDRENIYVYMSVAMVSSSNTACVCGDDTVRPTVLPERINYLLTLGYSLSSYSYLRPKIP